MNIKEAIQVLEETKVMTLIAIDTNYTANEGHRTQWKKEVEAISTILQELKHLPKENEELKTLLEEIILGGENWFEKKPYKLGIILGTKKRNEYWLNKIRKKIEELEEMLKKTIKGEIQRYTPGDIRLFISCLQDLLKEE